MREFSIKVAFATMAVVCPFGEAGAQAALALDILSSRPDMITDGDALVEVKAPPGARWTVRLNGADVTQSFKPAGNADSAVALLDKLHLGKNALEIQDDGKTKVRLDLLNHPRSGPIFSGPHQKPFVCQTQENGLGPPLDEDCSAKTLVQYYYRSTQPPKNGRKAFLAIYDSLYDTNAMTLPDGFKALDISKPIPADVDIIQSADGRRIPYIIRKEVGVINRAIYRIEFLHQPNQPLPTPWMRQNSGWNGRLVYAFGGGCGAGFHQGMLTRWGESGQVLNALLEQGYALASSSLNILGNDCNDKISAETAAMVKEYFIEQFGVPAHTIGTGASGGAVSVYLIAQNFPGILDGIIPIWSPPDIISGTILRSTDCVLLAHAFTRSSHTWTEAQKSAVSGLASWQACKGPVNLIDPRGCDSSLPKDLVYDRVKNPKGARCTVYDNAVNVFGRDNKTGYARRTLDNVGVQYGLAALNTGVITVEQFIELNELMGGFDVDGQIVSARTEADPQALRLAYERGELVYGRSLRNVPIIDWNPYLDDLVNLHTRDHALIVRERLLKATGNADNQVILVTPRPAYRGRFSLQPELLPGPDLSALVRSMDRWLTDIAADRSVSPVADKIARNKPAELTDGCVAADGTRIVEVMTFKGAERCNQIYPIHSNPRVVAGAPQGSDILKCSLKSLESSDYRVALSANQIERLKEAFPAGVCDYRRRPIGESEPILWNKLN